MERIANLLGTSEAAIYAALCILGSIALIGLIIFALVKTWKARKMHVSVKIILTVLFVAILGAGGYFLYTLTTLFWVLADLVKNGLNIK